MRKLHLILCIALFSILSLQAQEKGDVELGIVGGVTISGLIGSEVRTGSNVGGSFDYYFSDQWSLRIKAIYNRKGFANGIHYGPYYKYIIDDVDYIIDDVDYIIDYIDFQFNYLSFPMMANWHFGHLKNWNFAFGFHVAFLLDEHASSIGKIELTDANNFDFGLAFGFGYKFKIAENIRLLFEYELQRGFFDIGGFNLEENDGSIVWNNPPNFRHAFNVGLVFNLTKKKESETSHLPVLK